MLRAALVAMGFAAALPVFLVVGAALGFHLLLLLYLLAGLDFPTPVSILVGLSPVALSIMVWWVALTNAARR